ncbi:MAG: hypothetical protein JWQ00_1712 [Noviherbaspirillum sp.]|nr:hypothetical protein [Noviherbaspirillum sp.]
MAIEIGDIDSAGMADRAQRGGKPARAWLARPARRSAARERILFTERLSLQLGTGMTLHAALQSLHAQADTLRMQQTIAGLIDTIVEGRKFSDALARFPAVFPASYANLVAVSEGGGYLTQVLEQLLEMDEKQERLRDTLVAALSYPAFLVVFSVGVVVFILSAVFPKFASMFASIYSQLPVTTRILMAVSDALTKHPLAILAAVVLAVGGAALLLKSSAGAAWFDRATLRVPFIRDIFIEIYLTRLMRTMGISLQYGVTILATLTACREIISNREFQAFVTRLEADVNEGRGIAEGFKGTYFIPRTVLQMIATGEEAGQLSHVMLRIADFHDRALTKRLNQLSKLAEPAMLLIVGLIVGIIVSAMIVPIFKLSNGVH